MYCDLILIRKVISKTLLRVAKVPPPHKIAGTQASPGAIHLLHEKLGQGHQVLKWSNRGDNLLSKQQQPSTNQIEILHRSISIDMSRIMQFSAERLTFCISGWFIALINI